VTLGGPTTNSYNLSSTDLAWQTKISPTIKPLDFARSSPGVGSLPNGYLVVYGGTQNGFASSAVTQYDPNGQSITDGASNQTRALRSMNTPRASFGWATDPAFRSYAIGGLDNNGTPLSTVEVYNPTANTWTYLAPLPQALSGESAVSDGVGHLFVVGGVGVNGVISKNAYRYTIATNTWDQVAPMQVGVSNSAAVMGPNGLLYVLGGTTSAGAVSTVESFNIAANSWTIETPLPQAISSEAAAIDSLGRIDVIGGFDVNGEASASILVSQKLSQADLAPSITTTAPTNVVVNALYNYQVLSTGNPQATYSLTSAPAGMTIDSNTGLITWTPNYATEGIVSTTVVARNSVGQASQIIAINVSPDVPTGLSGYGESTTSIRLSWNASPDPNVTGYNVYRRTVLHDPKGSGSHYIYSRVASNFASTSVVLSGNASNPASGVYLVSAVNSVGLESVRSAAVGASVLSAPSLWGMLTSGGAVVSNISLNVGQTVHSTLLFYGNETPTFAVVSGPNGVTVDPVSGLVTYTARPLDVGHNLITFSATNSVGTSTFTFDFIVSAYAPTLTLNDSTVTYDGVLHSASASAVGNDGATPVPGSFAYSYNGDSTPPIAAGTYAVTATFTSTDPTYASAVATSTLTIAAATPQIWIIAGTFNYDGKAHEVTATALGIDGVAPVDGSFVFTYNDDSTAPIGPGLFNVSATFISNDPNYSSDVNSSYLIINSPGAMAPSLSLFVGSASYDGMAHAASASAFAADQVTPVEGGFLFTYNGSTDAPVNAGTYAVIAKFISADSQYANTITTGTLTINAVEPTFSWNATSFGYDGTSHGLAAAALGVDQATTVSGTLSVTYNGSVTQPVNAGVYEVSVAFISNDPNYLSASTTSELTITPAMSYAYVLSPNYNSTYDGTQHNFVGAAVGATGASVNGIFTFNYYQQYYPYTQLSGAPRDVGNYSFTEFFTSLDPNYAGTFTYGNFYIDAAEPLVRIVGGPLTYNGSTRSASITAVGVDGVTPIPGTASITYNGSSTAPSVAGTYVVAAYFYSTDPNYGSSSADGTLVINKATPAFSSLSSPSVNVGSSTVTVSGHIAAGSLAPSGDAVAIELNGLVQSVSIAANGNFTTILNIQGLSTGTYPITFRFQGDANRFGAASTSTGTLTVRAIPIVLTNPVSQTVVSGNSVTFISSATGYPAPTVQWQQSTNGTTYTNIVGATSPSYTIRAAAASQNGYRYRAVFTNSAGTATTTVATLTVQTPPAVTTNPVNRTVTAGQSTTMTAAATGNPTPTVQWQLSIDGGTTFSNIAGATSVTLTLSAATATQNGYRYRAMFASAVGTATTSAAILNVQYAPVITTTPVSQSVTVGQSATFTAAATGNPAPTVQWQVSSNGGATFTNIAGATSLTLTINRTTASQNGYRYRAVFANNVGSVITSSAILNVV
jgi:hypothetical protein